MKQIERYFNQDYDRNDPDYQDLCKLQQVWVQQAIDFINSHPNLKNLLNSKKQEAKEDGWTPDIRFNFSIDCMEESLEKNSWQPSSDSCIDVSISNLSILCAM